VLAGPSRPLVIFLDDLQWVDSASLVLIEVLMSDRDLSGLLIIGAYRDNEVHAGHPVHSLLTALESEHVPVRRIVLAPLERETVTPLIADALRISIADAEPLATLVTAKTGGNPFFVRQFLRALEEKDLLAFDSNGGRWIWDVTRIEQETISDNVVELVTGRIGRLPPNAQRLVRLAACLGARFDLKTLAAISGGAVRDAGAALAEPLAQEIIARSARATNTRHGPKRARTLPTGSLMTGCSRPPTR
jgi:predicted ATPase